MSELHVSAPSFDSQAILLQVDNDRDLLRELAEIFFEDTPKLTAQLEEAISEGDSEAAWQHAHAIKGMTANFAAQKAKSLAEEIELAGRENDLDTCNNRLGPLMAELDRLCRELGAFTG